MNLSHGPSCQWYLYTRVVDYKLFEQQYTEGGDQQCEGFRESGRSVATVVVAGLAEGGHLVGRRSRGAGASVRVVLFTLPRAATGYHQFTAHWKKTSVMGEALTDSYFSSISYFIPQFRI